MNVKLKRYNKVNTEFKNLVALLDKELALRDGDLHGFYDQYNKLNNISNIIIAYQESQPVGCGAIKAFDDYSMEVKRMFVLKSHRAKGIAQKILTELELWTEELDKKYCILETGKGQPEAIALYKKCGYQITENYGQYAGVENSVCFEKLLKS